MITLKTITLGDVQRLAKDAQAAGDHDLVFVCGEAGLMNTSGPSLARKCRALRICVREINARASATVAPENSR